MAVVLAETGIEGPALSTAHKDRSRSSTSPATRRHWPRAALQSGLVAVILTATLPLALLMTFRIIAEGHQQREALLDRLRGTARVVAVGVELELGATRVALLALAQSETLTAADLPAFERRLRTRGFLRPSWERLAVFNSEGALLFEVAGQGRGAVSIGTAEIDAIARAWVTQTADRSLIVSARYASPARLGTWIAVPATSSNGARHLLAVRVGPEVWQALLEGHALADASHLALFDGQRRMLASTRAPGRSTDETPHADGVPVMASRSTGTQKPLSIDASESYAAWQVLQKSDWSVGAAVAAGTFDAARQRANLWTFGVAAACLLLGVAAALVVAWRVGSPLQRLLQGGGGGADEPIEVAAASKLAERERSALMARERLARHDAQAANRAKDELLSMLGHELRNPLNAIVTSVEVLRRAPPESTTAESARAVIARQARKLASMVDDLLDIGHVMADEVTLQLRPLDLMPLVDACVAEARARAGERRQRLTHEALCSVWVRADPRRITQLLLNLLDNAIKHSPTGSTIHAELIQSDGTAVLRVHGSGPGIAPALLTRAFEPLVQGERAPERPAGGLGIGLTLVKRLVELHGGSVEARSSGEGSVLELRLPAIDLPGIARPAASRRVGVIDGHPDALEGLRAMLELAGHTVATAADGNAGLEMLLTQTPDVALVDIGLSGLDGLEIARRSRAAGFRGRLIALSGYGRQQDRERSLAAGFHAHLVKPIDPSLLMPLLHDS